MPTFAAGGKYFILMEVGHSLLYCGEGFTFVWIFSVLRPLVSVAQSPPGAKQPRNLPLRQLDYQLCMQ